MKKILIVDDDLLISNVLSAICVKEGLEAATEADGLRVVEKTRLEHPDLILLDIMLPGVSGLELLHTLKQDPELRHIPVITFTNLTSGNVCQEALSGGACQCLVKDQFKPSDIVKIILKTLNEVTESAVHSPRKI